MTQPDDDGRPPNTLMCQPEADPLSVVRNALSEGTLTRHDLRCLRAELRRERERVQALAIASGPTEELCRRMNEVEAMQVALGRVVCEDGRRGRAMRQALTVIRRRSLLRRRGAAESDEVQQQVH